MGHAAATAALCVPFALSLSKGERIGQPVCHGPEALFHLLFDAPSNETQVRLGTNKKCSSLSQAQYPVRQTHIPGCGIQGVGTLVSSCLFFHSILCCSENMRCT